MKKLYIGQKVYVYQINSDFKITGFAVHIDELPEHGMREPSVLTRSEGFSWRLTYLLTQIHETESDMMMAARDKLTELHKTYTSAMEANRSCLELIESSMKELEIL